VVADIEMGCGVVEAYRRVSVMQAVGEELRATEGVRTDRDDVLARDGQSAFEHEGCIEAEELAPAEDIPLPAQREHRPAVAHHEAVSWLALAGAVKAAEKLAAAVRELDEDAAAAARLVRWQKEGDVGPKAHLALAVAGRVLDVRYR